MCPVSPPGCLFEDELCTPYEFCVNGKSDSGSRERPPHLIILYNIPVVHNHHRPNTVPNPARLFLIIRGVYRQDRRPLENWLTEYVLAQLRYMSHV